VNVTGRVLGLREGKCEVDVVRWDDCEGGVQKRVKVDIRSMVRARIIKGFAVVVKGYIFAHGMGRERWEISRARQGGREGRHLTFSAFFGTEVGW
jgi:hypothetical protein